MQPRQPSGEQQQQQHAQATLDSTRPEIGTVKSSEGSVHPQPGVVHCFWALMTYGDLRFIYLSDSVQKAVNSKYEGLLGRSFFDFIHPDEAKLARKDLNAFMDVHNLYGSVTRCRFRNVCPDWQRFQQQLRQQKQQQQHASQQPENDSSNGLHASNASDNNPNRTSTMNDNHSKDASQDSSVVDPDTNGGFKCNGPEALKHYHNAFPNGEMDDYMILDVVMNVVGDQVVLGFFHIDGQGPYRGFWSGNKCGESKESLSTLASEILVHLRATTASIPVHPPSLQLQQEKSTSKDTKRIFQLYDTEKRSLLLSWPEPSADDNPADSTKMVYNPEFYTHIVQSHHIPADALANTTCLKRFCSKHAISGQGYPQEVQPIFQVESVFIPYGQVIFVCFQTSPAPPVSLSGSPSVGLGTLQALSESAYMSGSAVPAGRSTTSTSTTVHGSSAGSNPPLVIPSLPSLSPFLKHAVPSPTHTSNGGGPIPSSPLSGGSNNHFRPYPKPPTHHSGGASSNSSSPLLDQPGKLSASETDRLSNLSTWHASTPHPAMAAMVGHAMSPASSKYHHSHDSPTSTNVERRLPFPSDHVYQRERTVSSSALEQSSSTSAAMEPDASRPRARTTSLPAFSNGASVPPGTGSAQPIKQSGSRHPAHSAAIRIKTAPLPSTSPSGRARRESSSDSTEDSQHSAASKNGDADSVVSTYSCSNGGLVIRISQEEKTCESCHTTNSPEWRRGPSGKKNLCNACGLRYSRSVARQNRQAQKLADGKAGGGASAKPKGSKKQKAASKTTAATSPTKSPSDPHASSLSTASSPLSASLGTLSPHPSPLHGQSRTVDPRQGYTAAAAATLGDTSPYSHHPPQGNLSSTPAHSHMSTFV
ncbi:hypothetical protein BGZ73_005411 [Actinomortierella ambigua]|nr:hypothetical protein BGZ73_005411 [Actinomortierella ambigua]